METKNDNQLPFLDTLIQRSKNGELSSSIFRKPTHTDRYSNFRSYHPLQHKRAVLDTLMHRAVTLPSHKLEKRKEIKYIKIALKKNSYPSRILCSRKNTKAKITDSSHSNKRICRNFLFSWLVRKNWTKFDSIWRENGYETRSKIGTDPIISQEQNSIQSINGKVQSIKFHSKTVIWFT